MLAKLAISIVNHSNPELLRGCLMSIPAAAQGIEYSIYIVDNHSGCRLVGELREQFPTVTWIFNDRRRGFGFNHNQVMRRALEKYICILNDDTVLDAHALSDLVQHLESDKSVGLVGPRLLNLDGTVQDSAFRETTLTTEAIQSLILPRRLSWLKRFTVHRAQAGTIPADVEWLLGACIVVRQEVIEAVGLFDSHTFPVANNEEVDWCRRIRLAGYRIQICPEARVTHLGGQSMKAEASRVQWMFVEMMRTKTLYFYKHKGLIAAGVACILHFVASIWNCLMLANGRLRGRMTTETFQAALKTQFEIAKISLFPRRSPVGPFANY